MTVTFREFTPSDADYELLATLWNNAWPEFRRSVKTYKHDDESRPADTYFVRQFIELNGEPVGVGEYMEDWETATADDYFWLIAIDRSVDFKQVAEPYVVAMMADITSRGRVSAIGTILMEDRTAGCEFYQSLGYSPEMREPRSVLDVTQFDFSHYYWVDDKMVAEQIEIAILTDLQERYPDWKRRIYDLDWPLVKDVPSTVELKQQPFDEFIQRFESPTFLPEAAFYALDGDEWVGVSAVQLVDGADDELAVSITGVLQSHRRRGIATALKLKTIEFAQLHGAQTIKTTNEENNPMYDLNLALGFEPKPALIIFEQSFEAEKEKEAQHG